MTGAEQRSRSAPTSRNPDAPPPPTTPPPGESPTNSIIRDSLGDGEARIQKPRDKLDVDSQNSLLIAGYSIVAWMALVALVAQNSTQTVVMRATRVRAAPQDLYLASSAVVSSEVFKVVISTLLLYREQGSWEKFVNVFRQDVLGNPKGNLLILVPAGLYTLQNNLQYVAASNLDAAVFQVLYQMKLVTTAVVSVVVLQRSLACRQWLAVLVLTAGVSLVQLSTMSTSTKGGGNSAIGFVAVFTACVTSAFAGVLLEKIVKGSKESVWLRNLQLAVFGLTIGLGITFTKDREQVTARGFFAGFDYMVWFVVFLQGSGGLLTALVVKHADNVIKGFATGLAIIMSCLFSAYFFGFVITKQYVMGAVLVFASVFLFSLHKQAADWQDRHGKAKTITAVLLASLMWWSIFMFNPRSFSLRG